MLKNDAIVMYNPTDLVRLSGRVPKALRFIDNDANRTEYYIEPIIEGENMETAKIFYKLPIKFARKLLGNDYRYVLCFPNRMVVEKKNGKKFTTESKIEKACGEMPDASKVLNDDQLEQALIKRTEREIDEVEALNRGEAPEHMKAAAEIVAKNAKKTEATVEKDLADLKARQAEEEKKANRTYHAGPDEPNFDPSSVEKVPGGGQTVL